MARESRYWPGLAGVYPGADELEISAFPLEKNLYTN